MEVVVAHDELPDPPVPQAEAFAAIEPSGLTCKHRTEAPPKAETNRFVDDAVVAEIAVVEAYGKTEAVVVVAVKLPAVRLPKNVFWPDQALLSLRSVDEAVLSVPVIVTGEEPNTVKEAHDAEPEHDAVVVAVVPTRPPDPTYKAPSERVESLRDPLTVEDALE